MKYILSLLFVISTITATNACSPYAKQSFPTVPLSQFGFDSWKTATAPKTDRTPFVCPVYDAVRFWTPYPKQHFPTVDLNQFGFDSWKIAK